MFRSYSVAAETNQTEYSVDLPTGAVDDDIIVIGVILYATGTINLPTGWTDISGQRDIATDASMRVFCKVADSEPSTYTFTDILDTAASGRIYAMAYSGQDTTTPLDGVTPTYQQSGFTTAPEAPSITPATDGATVVGIHCCDSGSNPTGTPTTDWTDDVDVASRPTLFSESRVLASAGAVTSGPTMSAADVWGSLAFVLRPTAGGGGEVEISGNSHWPFMKHFFKGFGFASSSRTVTTGDGSTATEPWDDAGLTDDSDLTTVSGNVTLSTADETYEDMLVDGQITIAANNITVQNCRIYGSTYRGIVINDDVTGTVIQHCEIGRNSSSAHNVAGIQTQEGTDFTITENYIHHVRDGIGIEGGGTISKNIIEDIFTISEVPGDYHPDGIQSQGNISGLTITENKIICSDDTTSCLIFSQTAGPIDDLNITDNYINGGGITIYVRDSSGADRITNVDIDGNRFGWEYESHLVSEDIDDNLTWGTNTWYDPTMADGETGEDVHGNEREVGATILASEY